MMKVKALLSARSRSLFKVLEVKMSRLLLSSVLVALVAGLTLLACIPIEDELLPNIGDEMRITNDPEPNYDPCWYRAWDLPDEFGGPVNLNTAQIVYHDGHTAYLYSFEDKSEVELYSAPSGFEITTLDSTFDSLLIALFDGTETRIVYRDHNSGNNTNIYQDYGVEIDSIGGGYNKYEDLYYMLLGRSNGDIYYLIISDNKQLDYGLFSEGFDVHLGNGESTTYSFASGSGEFTVLYCTWYDGYDGFSDIQEVLNDGYYNRYPINGILCLSSASGDNDIWLFDDGIQITDKSGDEIEGDSTYEYIVFNRVEDGRSDIYVVRRRHDGQ